jgi:G patch domain and KOW motifs-containing protein
MKSGKSQDSGISFSLGRTKKSKGRHKNKNNNNNYQPFHDADDKEEVDDNYNQNENTDIPKEPLVIPLPKDTTSRTSFFKQEERANKVQHSYHHESNPVIINNKVVSNEDLAAIEALKQEASIEAKAKTNIENSLVIQKSSDTFQGSNGDDNNINNNNRESKEQFQKDLNKLPENVSVDSHLYKAIPISEFGAAMLRGMGWTGDDDDEKKKNNDQSNMNHLTESTIMPRPSRLGLGATPKMLPQQIMEDIPATHGGSKQRRPRRHDQVQREEQLKRQYDQLQQQRKKILSMDKQQTMQIGSIVQVHKDDHDDDNNNAGRRAKIYQLQGVPGLNMIQVVYEKEFQPTKVKKGSVTLIDRGTLLEKPFQEGIAPKKNDADHPNQQHKPPRDQRDSIYQQQQQQQRTKDDKTDQRKNKSTDFHNLTTKKRKTDNTSSSSSLQRHGKNNDHPPTTTWLIPNIRVRIVSRTYGSQYYKEKGVVVDVTPSGGATLLMDHGQQVLQVAERHLETALPKVGGQICILAGNHYYRFSKGKLLQRDSKANRGSVQLFEDLSIVTTSLDDMAEWCGPLDDDLDQPQY